MTNPATSPPPLPMTPTMMFGRIMAATNNAAYETALKVMDLPQQGTLLEIGFGAGKLIELALAKWPQAQFAGVDPTPAMVALATSNRLIKKVSNIDLRLGSAEQLVWDDGTFDGVVAVNSFQFWAPPEIAIAEIWRVLKSGGQVVLVLRDHSDFAPNWLPNPISKSGDEVRGALDILTQFGFAKLSAQETQKGQFVLTAHKP